jgi:alkaline phosphatase
MGGGRRHFLPTDVTDSEGKAGKRTDGRNIAEELKAAGGHYVEGETDFIALTLGNDAPIPGLAVLTRRGDEPDAGSGPPFL